MPSHDALVFCANHTENPYELAIVADQLESYEGVTPKTTLPVDWAREALQGSALDAAFAARWCRDEEALAYYAPRERRYSVQEAFADNPYLGEVSFRAMLERAKDDWAREMHRKRRAKALAELTRYLQAHRDGDVGLERVLADPLTYTSARVSTVVKRLYPFVVEDASVVARLLESEAQYAESRLALAYFEDYYCANASIESEERAMWDVCTLTPSEVLSLSRPAGARAKLLITFIGRFAAQNRLRRVLDAEFVAAMVASIPGEITDKWWDLYTKHIARFSAEAIDVLIGATRWESALCGQTLSDSQFEALLAKGDGVSSELLCNLAWANAHHLAALLPVAAARSGRGVGSFPSGVVDDLISNLASLDRSEVHTLIDSTAGLAQLMILEPMCSAHIYQRLVETGVGLLLAVTVLGDAPEASLDEVVAQLRGLSVV